MLPLLLTGPANVPADASGLPSLDTRLLPSVLLMWPTSVLCPKTALAEGEIVVSGSHLSYGSKTRMREYPESTTPMPCVPGRKKIAEGLNIAIEKICGSVGVGAPEATVSSAPITRAAD